MSTQKRNTSNHNVFSVKQCVSVSAVCLWAFVTNSVWQHSHDYFYFIETHLNWILRWQWLQGYGNRKHWMWEECSSGANQWNCAGTLKIRCERAHIYLQTSVHLQTACHLWTCFFFTFPDTAWFTIWVHHLHIHSRAWLNVTALRYICAVSS